MKTIDTQSYEATAPFIQSLSAVSNWLEEATLSHGNSAPSEKAKLPDGLFPVLMSTLQNSGDAHYHIRQREGRYHATNSAHGLRVIFTEAGVQVRLEKPYPTKLWDMSLTRWGYGDALEAVPKPTLMALDNRIEYQRKTLTEWYLNGPLGLEQGFTLTEPPPNKTSGEALVLELAFSEDKTRQLTGDGRSILWSKSDNSPDMMYGHLYANDATGRELPIHIEAVETEDCAAWHMRLTVDDKLAIYPILIDPIVQQAEFIASDSVIGDYFSVSVAINTDTAIIGASGKSSNAGTVYVFTRNGNTWTQQAKLTASDTAAGDFFGISVAISVNTIIVGAHNKNSAAGAVYVFTWTGNTWAQQAKLTASDAAAGDTFGGDLNISSNTIVIGANSKANTGAAYIFIGSGSIWTQQAKLTASDAAVNDSFGSRVAISMDTVVLSAPFKNSTGAAYVFTRTGNNWLQQAKLTAIDGATNDWFGIGVAVNINTLIVGAQAKNSSTGAAYVFTRSASVWTLQTELTAYDSAVSSQFGSAVAISANTYVIGSFAKNSITGEVYIFVANSDLPIIASSVMTTNANIAYGIAGLPVGAGQVVFADANAGLQIKPAHAYILTEATNVIGVALNTAGIGQPVAYAVSGDVTFNNVFTPGTTYLLSDVNPGALIPDNLLMPGDVGCVVGIATSPTNLRIHVNSSGVQK